MRNRGTLLVLAGVLAVLTVPIQASDAAKSLARVQESFASLSFGVVEAQTNVVNPAGITVVESGYNINDQGGVINLFNAQGAIVGSLGTDDFDEGGLALFDRFGNPRSLLWTSPDGNGQLVLFDAGTTPGVILDAAGGVSTLGGDVAERFAGSQAEIPRGSVVAIDADRPGRMRIADSAYDPRVAGVAAGANEYVPGVTLGAVPGRDNPVAVTLTGTVYCRVTNAGGPIRPGDLLTTSDVAGHAMRVADHAAARGAILGKAMEASDGETDLILILASLQ